MTDIRQATPPVVRLAVAYYFFPSTGCRLSWETVGLPLFTSYWELWEANLHGLFYLQQSEGERQQQHLHLVIHLPVQSDLALFIGALFVTVHLPGIRLFCITSKGMCQSRMQRPYFCVFTAGCGWGLAWAYPFSHRGNTYLLQQPTGTTHREQSGV